MDSNSDQSKHKSKSKSKDAEHKHKSHKRKKRDSERTEPSKSKRRKEESAKVSIVDDDVDDDDYWVEKSIDSSNIDTIPTAESLKLTSNASGSTVQDAVLPPSLPTETKQKREDWMLAPATEPSILEHNPRVMLPTGDESLTEDYGEPASGSRTRGGEVDFFSSIGTERTRKQVSESSMPRISSRELNHDIRLDSSGAMISTASTSTVDTPSKSKTVPGGPGSQWRMVKLRRIYETAQEEGREIEEVALERYGNMEEFQDAIEERRVLDSRQQSGSRRARGKEAQGEQRGDMKYMYSDIHSGPPSRSGSFRRPQTGSTPSTPGAQPHPVPSDGGALRNKNLERLRSSTSTPQPPAQTRTSVPSVFTPPPKGRGSSSEQTHSQSLSASELNKLQAKALRAKLMGGSDADQLQQEYEEALERSQGAHEKRVEVLPTLDGMGRLYDVGHGKNDDVSRKPGNRQKKEEKFETRDPKTGEVLRYNADDDNLTLGELLRQEKFGAGQNDQKDLDAQFARAIATDAKFEDNLDYVDDNADRLARRKMRSDAMKRAFAVNDYARTAKALSTCPYCFGEDDSPPKVGVVAMGTRCYLAVTTHEGLVDGHVCIVPIQHCLCSLEGDDDLWDEIKNFMKCIMRMCAEDDKGVVFYETVTNFRWQKHTYIECVPLPWELFDNVSQYFKESLLASESEWSTHRKVIDFSARPGGFRRAMVQNLPYFMVMFDYKGEKGFGHVIEGGGGGGMGAADDAQGDGPGEDEGKGGEFPRWFAAEILGNLLEVEPRRWLRPRRLDFGLNRSRVTAFRKKYDKFDWTVMLNQEPS